MNLIEQNIMELQIRADEEPDVDECVNHGFNILDLIIAKRDKLKGQDKRHCRNAGERIQEAIDAFEYEHFDHGIEKCRQAIEELRKIT